MKKLMIPLAFWAVPVAAWGQSALPSSAPAAAPEVAAAPAVSGHYYLQGVMETGSELLVRPDGKFQWYLVYGALDLFAEGTWTLEGDRLTLTATKEEKAPPPGFETLVLTVDARGLIPPDGRGAYVKDGEAPAPEPETEPVSKP